MTDKKRSIYFALFSVIILLVIVFTGRGHFYEVNTYKSGNGWGYDISKNNQTYIHQPYIPAIEGQIPFRTRHSARKTGHLVIKKIRNHKIPSVTREEIKAITGD
jgi:hypothetical protein